MAAAPEAAGAAGPGAKDEPPAEAAVKVKEAEAGQAAAQASTYVEEVDDDEDDVLPPEALPTFERNELPADPKFREDAVHVYGLDFLRTEHMNDVFSQFKHKFIEWINDSSANIIFKNKESARKALESLSYPKARDAPWRRTPDILVNDDCPPIFLQLRLAATTDVKRGRKAMPTVFAADAKGRGPANRRRAGTLGHVYRDGMTTELLEQAGLLGKKRQAPEELTEEEQGRRKRRMERFGEVEEASATPAAGAAQSGNAEEAARAGASGAGAGASAGGRRGAALGGEKIELTEEEAARRKKRAERFAAAEASATPAVASKAEPAAAAAAAKAPVAAC